MGHSSNVFEKRKAHNEGVISAKVSIPNLSASEKKVPDLNESYNDHSTNNQRSFIFELTLCTLICFQKSQLQ